MTKTTTAFLESFIKGVKDKAKVSSDFVSFYTWAHALNWKLVMTKQEFDRLVSVASVEADLA